MSERSPIDIRRHPERAAPFDIRTTYHPDGKIKTVTTYDQHGNAHRQYGLTERGHPPHEHSYDVVPAGRPTKGGKLERNVIVCTPRSNFAPDVAVENYSSPQWLAAGCALYNVPNSKAPSGTPSVAQSEVRWLTEESWRQLLGRFDWAHAFVREMYCVSDHFLMLAPQVNEGPRGERRGIPLLPTLQLVILTLTDRPPYGLAMVAHGISRIRLNLSESLDPTCSFTGYHRCFLQLLPGELEFAAEKVYVREIRECEITPLLLLGSEAPDDDYADALELDIEWRQCTVCGDGWREKGDREFSRCPRCLSLTRLV